jgi:aromatic-L-amino-acid decarboxylase
LAARIREHCRLATLFASWVQASTDWELLAPVPLGLVCFRAVPQRHGETEAAQARRLDQLNETIMHGVNASGMALLSHTRLHDKFTLRLSIGNIRTSEKHVRQVWALLNEQLALDHGGVV